jgi:dTDP-4-amino-4,6-dideoxygalactose transaminase
VNSATSGLHLALEALGAGPGDLVLVPSYTFVSTAEIVRYLGAEPVFVDVAPGSFHMDLRALEETLDRLSRGLPAYVRGNKGFGPRGKPRAAIPVHYGGLPCDMGALMEIAGRYGIGVIEDAAHAFPSRMEDGRWAGTVSHAGVFSFYATKTISTGEGGMVVCRDKTLADHISVMRSHGIDRTVWNRYTDRKASWYYEVVEAGYKYNLPDILAALGRVQLSRAMDLLEMRQGIASAYDAAFAGDPRFSPPPTGPGDARHLYPLRFNLEKLSLSRDTIIEELREGGIGVSVHFIPLHIMPYYRKRQNLSPGDFPESLKSFERVVSLPVWPGMRDSQVERVIAAVRAAARLTG